MCAGRATVHERRMGNHNPAQPPRTGAEKMKKIGDISIRVAHNVPKQRVRFNLLGAIRKYSRNVPYDII